MTRPSHTLKDKKTFGRSGSREPFTGKSGKSAIHEHISSYKNGHTYSIINFYALALANTDFDAILKEALYIPELNKHIMVHHFFFSYCFY